RWLSVARGRLGGGSPSLRLTREGLRVPSRTERQGFVGSGRASGQGTASGPPAPSRGPEASVGEPPCPRGLASLCRPVGVVHRGGRGAFVPLRSLLHAQAGCSRGIRAAAVTSARRGGVGADIRGVAVGSVRACEGRGSWSRRGTPRGASPAPTC